MINKCKQCSRDIHTYKSVNQLFCNLNCYNLWKPGHRTNTGRTLFKKGEASPRKGKWEPRITNKGYRVIRVNGEQILEHRYIWMLNNFYRIPEGFEVHHINGNKLDNRPENLFLISEKDHAIIHQKMRHIERRLGNVKENNGSVAILQ